MHACDHEGCQHTASLGSLFCPQHRRDRLAEMARRGYITAFPGGLDFTGILDRGALVRAGQPWWNGQPQPSMEMEVTKRDQLPPMAA